MGGTVVWHCWYLDRLVLKPEIHGSNLVIGKFFFTINHIEKTKIKKKNGPN